MKKTKVLPVNEIGIYKDDDGNEYESKIVGIILHEEEKGSFIVRAISEFDICEGGIEINDIDGFIRFKK
jgi:hypothetical protein